MDAERRYGIMIKSRDGRVRYSMVRFGTMDMAEKFAQSLTRTDPEHIYIGVELDSEDSIIQRDKDKSQT